MRAPTRCFAFLILCQAGGACRASAPAPAPIVYTLAAPNPARHELEVQARIPAAGRSSLEVMLPVWSPGYYAVQDYAREVRGLSARSAQGRPLAVTQSAPNHWQVAADGTGDVLLSYRLHCENRFVTTNWVAGDQAVINGPATFLRLVEPERRPYEVRLQLARGWKASATGLPPAPDRQPNHYRAPDYDTLVDCPIVAGAFAVHSFEVDGKRHDLVDIGPSGSWDAGRACRDLTQLVQAGRRFWGQLPYANYVFLNVFGPGAGGLEHQNSTMLSVTAPAPGQPQTPFRWLSYVSHEFFHAYNVKRLRPVELGPFDYDRPVRTRGLWVAEGLTSYYGPVIAVRAGLGRPEDLLAELSGCIRNLQHNPGRLKQTLEHASLDVWEEGASGVAGGDSGVSYYVKGPVVGFLLDARIRQATGGRRSLDDLMRLAYQRYSGDRGFTEEQFRQCAEEVAGTGLQAWFQQCLASTAELDYAEALATFGLRFASAPASPSWELELEPRPTPAQLAARQGWFGSSQK